MAAARDVGLPGIASFAKGLEQDVTSWSSGPVEGRVNRIISWNQSCRAVPVSDFSWLSVPCAG